jgi:hypothetical protein
MSDLIRFEQAERERDFYRVQGASVERERIVGLLMRLPVSAELWQVIQDLRGEQNEAS